MVSVMIVYVVATCLVWDTGDDFKHKTRTLIHSTYKFYGVRNGDNSIMSV
jgi:hypothetical protein